MAPTHRQPQTQMADRHDTPQDREAACVRLEEYYLSTATNAQCAVIPHRPYLTLTGLGYAYLAAGRLADADETLEQALAAAYQADAPYAAATAHTSLADVAHEADDPGRDARHLRRALGIYTSLGIPEAAVTAARLQGTGPP